MSPGPIRSVAVLMGGTSAEREVSLATGGQVADALRSRGHAVTPLDAADLSFIEILRAGGFDAVFICLHGRGGEDGTVQGLLELLGVAYVGSGVLASALAMDKIKTKRYLAGLPPERLGDARIPADTVLNRADPPDAAALAALWAHLAPKAVVKPACEGSAIGVTIAHDESEFAAAVAEAFEHDARVLVEEFVTGVEVTVGVLGNRELTALPSIEIVPEHEFYDYESKYVPGMSRHIIPAGVSSPARERCAELALAVHRALGCRAMSRTDMIVTAAEEVYFLEVNTIPGMTPTSLLPDAARAAGIEFPELVERLVELALEPED